MALRNRRLPKAAASGRHSLKLQKTELTRRAASEKKILLFGKIPIRRFHWRWKTFFIVLGCTIGVLAIGIGATFAYYVRDLPNPNILKTKALSQSTQILDRNGNSLYTVHGEENRTIVKGDQINNNVKEATIAIEDASFYKNHGFDLKGFTRAVLGHLPIFSHFVSAYGDASGGGSTITQQYVKNTLTGNQSTVTRKIKELILAIEVDQTYSKDDILTGYLNLIPYGSSAYGIEAASKLYFNKDAKDLTLSESATLAAIPNAPTYYSPYGEHLDDLFTRKDYILDRMAKVGFITQAQADAAKKDAPNVDNPNFSQPSDLAAPHFVFYAREQLINYLSPNDAQAGEKMLDEGGYKVTTSLDLTTQNLAQGILSQMGPDAVKKYHATNGCIVAVDPKTGEILAMAGSIDYNNSKSGNTNFCNADLQPGSSFKPIVYATAWDPDNKYAPSSITYDLPTDFGGGYKPNDYDGKFRGPVTDRDALDQSLNIPAVKNLYLAGVKNSIATAKSMGIDTLTRDPNDYGLSLVLGSGEVTPVEMAGAYATFADGGMHNPLRPILTIEQNGKVIKDFRTTAATKAIEPEIAYEMSNVLSDNTARTPVFGAHSPLYLSDRPVAAKTGTTENFRDGWTIGYTPSIVAAVWVGNNDPNQTMLKNIDGVVVAGPIWNKFMTEYLKGKPVEQFSRPSTVKDMKVDKLSGKLPTDQTPPDDIITGIFAPWQVPKSSDDVHIKVNLDKSTGKLATSLTPADQIQVQFYCTVHSEVPSNPNWENPVQAWAQANGCTGSPPTETDDLHTDANLPTITISTPQNGQTVNGNFTITAQVGGARPISSVEFFVNNVSIGVVTQSPWSITYNTANLPEGSTIIQATVTNDAELTATTQTTVTVGNTPKSTPPGDATKVQATSASKVMHQQIRVSWVNPSNADLQSANVYISSSQSTLGNKVATVSAPPSAQDSTSIPIDTLSVGTYYITVRPVNSAGQENQSTASTAANVTP